MESLLAGGPVCYRQGKQIKQLLLFRAEQPLEGECGVEMRDMEGDAIYSIE